MLRQLEAMNNNLLRYVFLLFSGVMWSQAQIKGTIIDAITSQPLPEVSIKIQGANSNTKTDALGVFILNNIELYGDQILIVEKNGFVTKRLPVIINDKELLELQIVTLDVDITEEQRQIGLISLSENDLISDDTQESFNTSGLLSAGRDAFLSAAAFDWSATFFRPRGLDNANGKLLINGIEMNKQFNGRPQWGSWGGLNDAQRNREFTQGLKASEYNKYHHASISGAKRR